MLKIHDAERNLKQQKRADLKGFHKASTLADCIMFLNNISSVVLILLLKSLKNLYYKIRVALYSHSIVHTKISIVQNDV
jgi:hypothetical protein